MGAEPLAAVCELAFAVAKEGVDAAPPIEPPAAMRSYLYVSQLPVRAFTVTERTLDEDDGFRHRVAIRATEQSVGRAGFLFLHRPEGWETEYVSIVGASPRSVSSALSSTAPSSMAPTPPPPPPGSAPATNTAPPIPEPPSSPAAIASIPPEPSLGVDASDPIKGTAGSASITPASSPAVGPDTPNFEPPTHEVTTVPTPPASSSLSSDSIIEDELSSLRHLVDRLADERKNVRNSVKDLENEVESRRAETHEMSTHLQNLERDLALSRAAEATLTEQHDAAAATIAELTAERDALLAERDAGRASVENANAERDSALVESSSLRESLDRTEQSRQALEIERNAFGTERDNLRSEKAALVTANDDLTRRLDVAEQARVDLESQLEDVSSKWQSLRLEIADVDQRRSELVVQVSSLAGERDATAATQRDLVSSMNTKLDQIRAEREAIAHQLQITQQHLASTRNALSEAGQSVAAELSLVDQAVADSIASVASIESGSNDVVEQVADLQALEPNSIEVPADEIAPSLLEASPAAEEVDAPSDDQPGEPASVVPEIVEASIPEPPEPVEPGTTSTALHSDVDEPIDPLDSAALGSDSIDSVDADADVAAEPTELDAEEFDTSSFNPDGDIGELAGFLDEPGFPEAPPTESTDLDNALASYGMGADDLQAPVPPSTVDLDPELVRSASGRMTMVVPEALKGDELATAKCLVYASDVVLLVDGDPTAGIGWADFPAADRRRALVQYLNQLAAEIGTASDVVLYRSISDEFPEPKAVRVRECDDSVNRPDYFSNIVDGYPPEWPIVVITDDVDIAIASQGRGASVLTSVQLLDVLQAFYEAS